MAQVQHLKLLVNNSSTILSRLIEIITCRRINIDYLLAHQHEQGIGQLLIDLKIEATHDQVRLLKPQLEKQIDVVFCQHASAAYMCEADIETI